MTTDDDVTAAVRRLMNSPTTDPADAAILEAASGNRRADAELTAEVVSRMSGRPTAADAKFSSQIHEAFSGRRSDLTDLSEAQAAARAEHEAAPWLAEVAFGQSDALRAAEARYVDLCVTRRGQSRAYATQWVRSKLIEAWDHPGGFGTSTDRLAAVVTELRTATERMSKLDNTRGNR